MNPPLLQITKPMQPKVPGIKPRKIHQLVLGVISFHFQIIKSASTSKSCHRLNGSTDPKSQLSDNLEVRPLVSDIKPDQTSCLRTMWHPIIIKTQPQSLQLWLKSLHFFLRWSILPWRYTRHWETEVQHLSGGQLQRHDSLVCPLPSVAHQCIWVRLARIIHRQRTGEPYMHGKRLRVKSASSFYLAF